MQDQELPSHIVYLWSGVYICKRCDVFTNNPEDHLHKPQESWRVQLDQMDKDVIWVLFMVGSVGLLWLYVH